MAKGIAFIIWPFEEVDEKSDIARFEKQTDHPYLNGEDEGSIYMEDLMCFDQVW